MGKKSKSTTTNKTVYGNTTTTNPYVSSQTTNKGTASVFNPGTAFESINTFVNKNMDTLLDEYLNPSLNSTTNKAKMAAYTDALNKQTATSLENDIINPLSKRNMIRSSQATNLYKNLANNNAGNIANYAGELLQNSQTETGKLLNNLLLMYMNGYNALSDTQHQSLATSQGNATSTQTTKSSSFDDIQALQMAMQMATMFLGAK